MRWEAELVDPREGGGRDGGFILVTIVGAGYYSCKEKPIRQIPKCINIGRTFGGGYYLSSSHLNAAVRAMNDGAS